MNIESDSLNGLVPSNQGPFTSFSALCNDNEPAPVTSSPNSDSWNHFLEEYGPHMTAGGLSEDEPEFDDIIEPSTLIRYTTPQPVFCLWNQPQTRICDKPETELLFNHYSLHVANILQPLSHIGNPYRSLYVPAALEGSMETLAKHAAPNVRLCIFHSLVATAAFHMSSCNPSLHRYHKTGILHRQMALQCMQLALTEGTSQSNYRQFMVALCSLLTIGVRIAGFCAISIH